MFYGAVSPSPAKAAKLAVRKDLFGHSKEDSPEEGQEQEADADHSGEFMLLLSDILGVIIQSILGVIIQSN